MSSLGWNAFDQHCEAKRGNQAAVSRSDGYEGKVPKRRREIEAAIDMERRRALVEMERALLRRRRCDACRQPHAACDCNTSYE